MLTNYAANKFLSLFTAHANSASFTSNVYVGLSTTEPLADGTGVTEPVGNGYTRTLLGAYGQAATLKLSTPVAGATANDDIIFFPEATGNWGICTHFVIYDALVAGNLMAGDILVAPITPISGNVPIIRVGDLTITLA